MEPANLLTSSAAQDAVLMTSAVALASLGAASLLLPGLRALVFPQPRYGRYSAHVPLVAVENDGTLHHPDGRISRVYRLDGADTSLSNDKAAEAAALSRLTWAVSTARSNVEVRIYSRRAQAELPPCNDHPVPLFAEIESLQHAELLPHFETTDHIILTPRSKVGGNARQDLDEAEGRLIASLARYKPTRLTQDQGEAAAFFGPFLSPLTLPAPVGAGDMLNSTLSADNVRFDFRQGLIRFHQPGGRSVYMAVWTLRGLGMETNTRFTSDLLSLDAQLLLLQAFNVKSQADSVKELREKNLFAKSDETEAAGEVITEALSNIQSGKKPEANATFGWALFATVEYDGVAEKVPAAVLDELRDINARITGVCAGYGFTASREGAFLRATYNSLFPTYPLTATPRTYQASNIASSVSFARSHPGTPRSQWMATPIGRYKTALGDLFNYGWHVTGEDNDPIGHTTALGMPGSGKTTLIVRNAQRTLANPRLQVVWCDAYQAAYVPTKALGPLGRYITLTGDRATAGANPAQRPDTPENRAHLRFLLTLIVAGNSTGDLPPVVSEQIDRAVKIAFHPATPRPLRNLRHIVPAAFPSPLDGTEAAAGHAFMATRRWIDDPALSNILCAEEDGLSLDGEARWVTFDYEYALNDPLSAGLIVADITHQTIQSLRRNRRPTLIVLDEAKLNLALPRMPQWFATCHDQIRRLDGVFVSMWQRPQQIHDVGVESVIKQSAPTRWVFPSEDADPEEYRQLLGFSDTQCDVLTRTSPMAQRLRRPAILDRPSYSVVVETDMSAIRHRIAAYAGSRGATALQDLEQEYGEAEGFRRYMARAALEFRS